jgi:hypothetical protein
MPALPAAPKVIRVICRQVLQDDNDVLNRYYLSYSGTAPTSAQLSTFCGSVATAWGVDISPLQNTNITLVEVSAEDLSSATSAVGTVAVSVPGTRGGATLSAAACVVVNFDIARRYRGGHPRIYLWAGSETDIQTVGTWKAAFLAAVQSGWVAFTTAVEAAGWAGAGTIEQVNVSFYEGFDNFTYPSGRTRPRPRVRLAPIIDAVVAIAARAIIGSIRRRNQ